MTDSTSKLLGGRGAGQDHFFGVNYGERRRSRRNGWSSFRQSSANHRGGSGIGRATAIVFGREGAKVAIADHNRDSGEQTVRTIKDAGGQALFIEANVAIARQAEAMIAKTIETYGRLDCAFNNAGIEGQVGPNIADCSEENWGRIIAVNLTGVFLCMKYELLRRCSNRAGGEHR